ncbi:hypothetical protein [Streptomyces aurantiogriseus]|uniref:Uncharacterized protein n=1 Tax=Streptomyces aurantiogriseus TaxID=66870 RepID=A0A918CM61_9ACTN|nr:hypothetical protein [Streptomyces aurantiogriseus]GGR30466.1 hypothetical protein GCM10010251_53100 [Streptomyces aurantiogriseus]
MPDVTSSGEDRWGRRNEQNQDRTRLVSGGQEAPATTAEMRAAMVEETRDARGARAAGEGGMGADAKGAGTPVGGGHRPEGSHGSPLLPNEECDKLTSRIQHAVAEFVDRPRDAVEEADHVLEELAARFTDAVNSRRRTLRGSWQLAEGAKGDTVTTADTEQLRLALRDYRELTERLLHM